MQVKNGKFVRLPAEGEACDRAVGVKLIGESTVATTTTVGTRVVAGLDTNTDGEGEPAPAGPLASAYSAARD